LGAYSFAKSFFGGVVSQTDSASPTFDFAYWGDLLLGLIDDQVSGFANGGGAVPEPSTWAISALLFRIASRSVEGPKSFLNLGPLSLLKEAGIAQ
jgi:hypothetical protein